LNARNIIKAGEIFVTGSTGFVGVHLVKELSKQGFQCRCLVRNFRMAKQIFRGYKGVEFLNGDLTESNTLEHIPDKAHTVIHLAALLGDFCNRETDIWDVNVNGTINLLMRLGMTKKFVFCSTPGVQGFGHRMAKEELPYRCFGVYEKSKVEAEKLVIRECTKKGINWLILRPDFVYGPGDLRRLPLYRRIAEKKMYVLGDGQATITPTYIEDVIQGFIRCIENDDVPSGIFNISGRPLTVEAYLTTIADILDTSLPKIRIPLFVSRVAASACEVIYQYILDREPPISMSKVKFLTEDHGTDNRKAREILDFTPRFFFAQGMRKTIDWYKKEKLLKC